LLWGWLEPIGVANANGAQAAMTSTGELALPDFSVRVLGERQLAIDNQGFPYSPEMTPLVKMQPNGKRLYLISTAWSWLCESSENLLDSSPADPLNLHPQDCKLITQHVILDRTDSWGGPIFKPPDEIPPADWDKHWKRLYDGIFGFHWVGDRLIALKHGEHANAKFGDEFYQGNVFPDCEYDDCLQSNGIVDWCWSGDDDGVYQHCWESFAGFASLGWAPYSGSTGWNQEDWIDEGPVFWPPLAYRNSAGRPTGGHAYGTTSFVHDGYFYLYTVTYPLGHRGKQCTVAARAPLSPNGMPGNWKTFYNGSFSEDSLPAGFDKDRLDDFYERRGGQASCVMDSHQSDAALFFNVARIRGTPYFMGVEESLRNGQTWQMGVRLSHDLVHWSPIQVLSESSGSWGVDQQYSAPTFVDRDATTNYEIDSWDFYILGKAHDNSMGSPTNAMRLALDCPALSVPGGLTPRGAIDPGEVTLSWDPTPNAAFYAIRIDDLSDGFRCDNPNPNDVCQDDVVGTTFSFEAKPGHTYYIWLHARNICGNWGPHTDTTLQVAAGAPADKPQVWDFSSGIGDWVLGHGGRHYDTARWYQDIGNPGGSVMLDGSDQGSEDNSANAWMEHVLDLSGVAQASVSFEMLAATDAAYRVLLRSPNGTWIALQNWTVVRRSEGWATRSVDLSLYAGQIVTLRIEQDDDGNGSLEMVFVDNVALSTSSTPPPPLTVSASWDFASNSGGWILGSGVRRYDSSKWYQDIGNPGGSIILDGSDMGQHDTAANAWMTHELNLSGAARASVSFEILAATDAAYRVSLGLPNGSWDVLQNWAPISNAEGWAQKEFDLSNYGNRTVSLRIEQDDGGDGSLEMVFVDNVTLKLGE